MTNITENSLIENSALEKQLEEKLADLNNRIFN